MRILTFVIICFIFSSCSNQEPSYYGPPTFSSDGVYLTFSIVRSNSEKIYQCRKDGTGLIQLTEGKGFDTYPYHSPDGSKIVFSRYGSKEPGDQGDLYVINADGSNGIQLTSTEDNDFYPVFSPDGARIYFVRAVSFGRNSPMVSSRWHEMDLYSINSNGSDLKRLTSGRYYQMSRPSFAPDGQEILIGIIDTSPYSIWLLPTENPSFKKPVIPDIGTYLANLNTPDTSKVSVKYNDFSNPVFAPDGKSIVFNWAATIGKRGYFEYELYSMNLESTDVHKITSGGKNASWPSFSPSGGIITFLFYPNWPKRNSVSCLMTVRFDGSDLKQVLPMPK